GLDTTANGARDAFLIKLPDVGPLTFTASGTNGTDNMVLQINGANLILLRNGAQAASRILANTTGAVITGAANEADSLTIDNSGGVLPLGDGILFNGNTGDSNTLLIAGTAGADTFNLSTAGVLFNNTQAVNFTNVQAVTALGGAGDLAFLSDGPGDDVLTGTPTFTTLTVA